MYKPIILKNLQSAYVSIATSKEWRVFKIASFVDELAAFRYSLAAFSRESS